MAVLLVTRHPGVCDWVRRRGLDARAVAHLNVEQVAAGDTVIGTLPAHLAAAISARGARYLHLALDLPPEARGQELSADDMQRYGARLLEIEARIVGEVT